ncbi:MAG TPA: alpha/beta hydrolase [Burkholderiaceae bacterium]|nr:alpha/beta hydrolase [Burkholderiaceae bacterium]
MSNSSSTPPNPAPSAAPARAAAPYDVEAASPGFREHLQRYSVASRETRARWPARLDVRYGDGAAERLDIFLTDRSAAAPIVVFLHGGGWRGSSKEDRSFPAETFCPAGAIWISMEYPLAPAASVDQMVESVRRGIAWVHRNAHTFAGDRDRIFVCGNSAGGHLAAMAMVTDWSTGWHLPESPIRGATTISGVFQMTPLRHGHANTWLKLDVDSAVRNSPIFNLPARGSPLLCVAAANEPPEFREQSEVFAAVWRNRGFAGEYLLMPDVDHFSIIGELGKPASRLVSAMLRQMGLEPAAAARVVT